MRILLVFHTMHTDVAEYTKGGKGLRVTTKYKKCCDDLYTYEVEQEFFELRGKHMRRARRKDKRNG